MGIHHSTVSFGCEGNENLTGREKLGKLCFRPFPITLRGIRGKKFRSQIGVKTSDCNICEHVYVVCRSLCPWLHGMILVFLSGLSAMQELVPSSLIRPQRQQTQSGPRKVGLYSKKEDCTTCPCAHHNRRHRDDTTRRWTRHLIKYLIEKVLFYPLPNEPYQGGDWIHPYERNVAPGKGNRDALWKMQERIAYVGSGIYVRRFYSHHRTMVKRVWRR